jgi:hypothetical protein
VKGRITFCLPPDHPSDNKIALRWKFCLTNRQMAQAICNALQVSADTMYIFTLAQLAAIKNTKSIAHIKMYNHDNDKLRRGVLDGSIPSAAADSGATSSIGTKRYSKHFTSTSQQSQKIFRSPNGATEQVSNIGHLPTVVRGPARDIHITPGIDETSLISTVKFAEVGYVTVFNRNEVNIYDQRDTVITISRAAILCVWR